MINPNSVADFIGKVAKNASTLPADLQDLANRLNNEQIKIAQGVDSTKQQTKQQIQQNLKQNKLREYWNELFDWVRDPQHLLIAVLGVVLSILALRKL